MAFCVTVMLLLLGKNTQASTNKDLLVEVRQKQAELQRVTPDSVRQQYRNLITFSILNGDVTSHKVSGKNRNSGAQVTTVPLLGYVDGLEPLDEFNVVLHLRHLGFQLLSVGFLRHGLCDQREALVLMVQLIPGLLQTLDTNTGHLCRTDI